MFLRSVRLDVPPNGRAYSAQLHMTLKRKECIGMRSGRMLRASAAVAPVSRADRVTQDYMSELSTWHVTVEKGRALSLPDVGSLLGE